MTSLEILQAEDREAWLNALRRTYRYDIYHLPEYHALAQARGEGLGRLLVYHDGPHTLALPLLLRKVDAEPALRQLGRGWMDATSVYGYPGPISSHEVVPAAVLRRFSQHLEQTLRDLHVVCAFSRLNPLLPQPQLLAYAGEIKRMGHTVVIDLTLSPDAQWSKFRENHRRGIRKLEQMGLICIHDQEFQYLDRFVDIYYETMRRVQARSDYFFEPAYFSTLISSMQPHVALFVALLDEEVVAAGLFTSCTDIAQYHLGGTSNQYLQLSPFKLVIDRARLWAYDKGMSALNLGGGTGSQEDSLFRFKAGFSDDRRHFFTWQWVLFPEMYDKLQSESLDWQRRNGQVSQPTTYFPEYRSRPGSPVA